MTDTPDAPSESHIEVAVVGGGVAGLTAALRLAQQGYAVTLFEASDFLGGNLSTARVGTRRYDVYPHMFPTWYANFWRIFEDDLGLKREDHFAGQGGIKLLKPDGGGYVDLFNPTTPEAMRGNLTSGVLPPADLFLLGFAMLDLAAQPVDAKRLLGRLSVNGHLYSRGYATDRVADFSNYILQLIWSIPSDRTSALAYRDFLKHAFQLQAPKVFAWMPRGDVETQIIAPWRAKLEALGCVIRTGTAVERIGIDGAGKTLHLTGGATVRADTLVLAVPPPVLAHLAITGTRGERLADHVPTLSEAAQLRAESIPVVTVVFKRQLEGLPRDVVGLLGSDESLSFVDISQLWDLAPPQPGRTVLALSCSNVYALPAHADHERGWLMIRALAAYLPVFKAGTAWGDPNCDIDWQETHYATNARHRIHVDQAGDEPAMPDTAYDALPGVFFAGDCCRTDVMMATVEAAAQSGVQAAQALQKHRPRGATIEMAPHVVYSDALFLAIKLLMLPTAYAAAAWSHASDQKTNLTVDPPPADPLAPAANLALLPAAFLKDLAATLSDLARTIARPPPANGDTIAPPPTPGAVAEALLNGGRSLFDAVLHASGAPSAPTPPGPPVGAHPPRYQRRWRVKF